MAVNINQITTQIDTFIELDEQKDIVRLEELGKDLAFTELSDLIPPIKQLFSRIKKEVDWAIISDQLGTKFQKDLNTFNSQLTSLKNFNSNQGNLQQKTNIVNQFRNSYSATTSSGADIINHNLVLNPSVEQAEETLRSLIGNLNAKEKEANKILKNISEAAGQSGVSKYAESFATISSKYGDYANYWLVATIASIGLLIGGGLYILENYGDATVPAQIINNTISKLIVLTGLIYLVTLSIRSYKANRHNQIVNRQKATALNIFKVFIDAADENDPQTLNAILLETTRSIFANTNSGFMGGSSDSADLSPKVIEIFKDVGKNNSL